MSHVKNGVHKHAKGKSRTDLLQELDELKTLLAKREEELTAYQETLRLAQGAEDIQQLHEKLNESQQQLNTTTQELAQLREQTNQFEMKNEALSIQSQRLSAENEKLKKEMTAEREEATELLDEAIKEQQNTEQKYRDLERKLRQLEETRIAEEGRVPPSQVIKTIEPEVTGAPTSTFRLEFYPRQGDYVGKIEHPLSRDKRVLKGLDQKAITDFIAAHLPQAIEKPAEETVAKVPSVAEAQPSKKEVRQPGIAPGQVPTERPGPSGVIREIKVRQGRNVVSGKAAVVRPGLPFSVAVQLHLPAAPMQNKMELWLSSYSVRLVAQRAQSTKPAAERVVANDLAPQKADYETTVPMPALSPGNYTLHAYTLIPYAHLAEHETMVLNVA